MRIRPGIELASLSDIGCLRPNNEDNYSYWEPADDESFRRQGRLVIVADGMGGHEGGQEASRIAVDTLKKTYAEASAGNPRDGLVAGLHAAHRNILLYGMQYPHMQGLGTTCTAIAITGNSLYFVHIGDSRLYLLRNAGVQRLTRDHSYVGELLDSGVIGPAEAAVHPRRNILLKALGVGDVVEPEILADPIALLNKDVLLLCTDGLWSMVTEDEISASAAMGTLAQACQTLVDKSKERGGPDNITLQMVRFLS